MSIHCLILCKDWASRGSQQKPVSGGTHQMDLLKGSRPGCFLLKHMMSAESSLDKLLDIETFWRILSTQIAKVGKYS